MTELSSLTRKLNYTFNQEIYLKQALTHRSASEKHNERFEFLGDALLSTVITYALYKQFPKEDEGQLSRLRAYLVKGETLGEIAQEIQLGNFLILGQGELKSGSFRRTSILADALEALIAAVFLDGGFNACEQVVLHLFKGRLQDNLTELNLKDPKTQLQEYLQSKKLPLPVYKVTDSIENDQDPVFFITCTLQKPSLLAKGEGSTRRKAEQQAAEILLIELKKNII